MLADPALLELAIEEVLTHGGSDRPVRPAVDDHPGQPTVEICDHGAGVHPAGVSRPATAFYRGAGARREQRSGLGPATTSGCRSGCRPPQTAVAATCSSTSGRSGIRLPRLLRL